LQRELQQARRDLRLRIPIRHSARVRAAQRLLDEGIHQEIFSMDPKSGKPPRLLVNPFAMWTDLALRSGRAMLESTQAALTRAPTPKVAVLPSADSSSPDALPAKPASAESPSPEAPPSPKALRAKPQRRKVASKPKRKKRRAKR